MPSFLKKALAIIQLYGNLSAIECYVDGVRRLRGRSGGGTETAREKQEKGVLDNEGNSKTRATDNGSRGDDGNDGERRQSKLECGRWRLG